jgi:hypothetical protein
VFNSALIERCPVSGKEYVKETIEKMGELIEGLKDSGQLNNETVLAELGKSVDVLEGLKNKATLRTKSGTNTAFQVLDAAQKLEEALEDDEDVDILVELCEAFISNANTLQASLKERTVIMT